MSKINSIIIILCIVFSSCTKGTMTENAYQHEVNPQILTIVDSVERMRPDNPFITVFFYSQGDTLFVDFVNSTFSEYDKIPLGESPNYLGYKKRNDNYLMFVQESDSEPVSILLKKEKLFRDREPFDILENLPKNRLGSPTRYQYWVNESDSLIFIKKEHI